MIHSTLGSYDKAEQYFQNSLALLDDKPDNDLPRAYILLYYGFHMLNLNNVKDAQKSFNLSLTSFIKISENTSPIVAWNYIGLGKVNNTLGNYTQAEQYAKTGLQMIQEFFPYDHPGISRAQHILGEIKLNLQQYDEAETLMTIAFSSGKSEHLKSNTLLLADLYNNLARLHLHKKNVDKAETYANKALSIYLAYNHPHTKYSYKIIESIILMKNNLHNHTVFLQHQLLIPFSRLNWSNVFKREEA